MPQIIVTADAPAGGDEAPVMLRERVNQSDFESDHFAQQLVERLGWAVGDAHELQQDRADAHELRQERAEAAAEQAHVAEGTEPQVVQPEAAECDERDEQPDADYAPARVLTTAS